jgi:hypothetical protein
MNSRENPYTLLPIIVAAAKVIYVLLCVVAVVLITALLFNPNASAGQTQTQHRPTSIYYVDASFAGCDIMGAPPSPNWCYGPRLETYLHALAALGGDALQSDALTNGAVTSDLQDAITHRFENYWWNPKLPLSEPQVPEHIIWGFSNDVWQQSDRQSALDALQWLAKEVAYWSPGTTIWALQYPPLSGCNETCKSFLDDPALYESFRARYAKLAATFKNVTLVQGAYYNWQASDAPHPTLPGPDFHPASQSTFDTALRVYTKIRSAR